jgi:hypothetical protein
MCNATTKEGGVTSAATSAPWPLFCFCFPLFFGLIAFFGFITSYATTGLSVLYHPVSGGGVLPPLEVGHVLDTRHASTHRPTTTTHNTKTQHHLSCLKRREQRRKDSRMQCAVRSGTLCSVWTSVWCVAECSSAESLCHLPQLSAWSDGDLVRCAASTSTPNHQKAHPELITC